MSGRREPPPDLNAHDRRLFWAVAGHKPMHDGLCDVFTYGKRLDVKCYGKRIFSIDRDTGFWEAQNWNITHRWMRDKLNACLAGVMAPVRVFYGGGKFWLTNKDGHVKPGNVFNSERSIR